MKILLSNRTYDVLKWVCLIAMPALAAALAAIGQIWGVADMDKVVLTVNTLTAFLGALIGVSCAQYREGRHE